MGGCPYGLDALVGGKSSELEGLADGPQADDNPYAAVSLEHR